MNPDMMQEELSPEMELNEEIGGEIDPAEDMTDDDIAASLGFVTTLSEQMLPQDDMTTAEGEEMETPEDAPAEPEAEEEPGEMEEPEENEMGEDEKDEEIQRLKAEIYDLKNGASPE